MSEEVRVQTGESITSLKHKCGLLADALRRILITDGVLDPHSSPSGPELLLATDGYIEHIENNPPRVRLTGIEDLSPREAEAVRMEADLFVEAAIEKAKRRLKESKK